MKTRAELYEIRRTNKRKITSDKVALKKHLLSIGHDLANFEIDLLIKLHNEATDNENKMDLLRVAMLCSR